MLRHIRRAPLVSRHLVGRDACELTYVGHWILKVVDIGMVVSRHADLG